MDVARTAAIRGLMQSCFPLDMQPDPKLKETRQCKVPDKKMRHLPVPIPPTAAASRPAPYPQNLTPILSILHPHCLARDWLRRWTSASV